MYRRAWLLTLQSLWTPQYVNVIGKIKEEVEKRQREGRGGETYFILHSVNPFLHQVSSVLSCAAVLRNTRVLDIRLVFRVHVLPPSTHNHLQSRKTDWTILKTTFEDIIVGLDQSAQSISCAPWAKKKNLHVQQFMIYVEDMRVKKQLFLHCNVELVSVGILKRKKCSHTWMHFQTACFTYLANTCSDNKFWLELCDWV